MRGKKTEIKRCIVLKKKKNTKHTRTKNPTQNPILTYRNIPQMTQASVHLKPTYIYMKEQTLNLHLKRPQGLPDINYLTLNASY